MSRFKRYRRLLLVVILLGLLVCETVQAKEISVQNLSEEKRERGSISIILSEEKEEMRGEGVTFSYAKVAEFSEGTYRGIRVGEKLAFEKIKTAEDMKNAAIRLANIIRTPDGEIEIDSEGKAVAENLEVGVYLFYVSAGAKYERITPFLVSIPSWDEVAGDMNYDVKVLPKREQVLKETPSAPQTKDDSECLLLFVAAVISLLLAYLVLLIKKIKSSLFG